MYISLVEWTCHGSAVERQIIFLECTEGVFRPELNLEKETASALSFENGYHPGFDKREGAMGPGN
jgi:hypothetical protein